MLDNLQEHFMQSFVAFEDRSPHVQHGLNHHRKYRITVLEQLADPCFIAPAVDGSNQQAVGPERATNVVLDVDQFALQKLPISTTVAYLL